MRADGRAPVPDPVPAMLRVRVLGGLAIEGVDPSELGSRKARLMIKVLALARGASIPIGVLAEILWGDAQPTRPGDQVSVLASRLRKVLGIDRIQRSEAGLRLRMEWLDVDELHSLTEEACSALGSGRLAAARAASRAAVDLARGPVLPDDEGDWLEAERARAEAAVSLARRVAADAALRSGDHVAAELLAETVLAHDPYDESALRVLMHAQVADRRRASALASYARLRQRLGEDLGVSPSAETERLHTMVLLGAGLAPHSAPSPQRFVGRQAELARLSTLLESAGASVQVVHVIGEPGIGKTTLVQRFADSARELGVRALFGAVDELGRDLPLQPVLDATAAGAESPGTAGGEARSVTTMSDALTDQTRWFEHVLHHLTEAGQTLLVLDDVQWCDRATAEWLSWVQRRPCSMLVVAIGRPGRAVRGAEELVLGPLDVEAIGALIGAADDLNRAEHVHARSGGNPLFALALASAPEGSVPSSVEEAVVPTLAGLASVTAELVLAAAVLDAVDDLDLLAGVMRRPAVDVVEQLEHAASVGLLAERDAGFEFRHPLVREALARMVGVTRAAFLHREASRVLDARPRRDPLGVAVHARLGGASEIAASAFVEAALVSFERADLNAAEQHLRAAIRAVDTAHARSALARVLMVAQRLDDAVAEAERGIALGGGPEAFEIAGWIEYYRRNYPRAQRLADEAVTRADPGSPLSASALALGGRIRHGVGDLGDSEPRLVAAVAGPPAVRALAEVWLGQVRVHQGRPVEALELVEHALLDPEHIAHPFASLHGRFARVMAFGQHGQVREGLAACAELRSAIDRAGAFGVRFDSVERNVRSWLLRGIERFDEADALNWEAIARNGARDGSGPVSEGFAEAYWVAFLDLASGCVQRHDLDQAAALVGRLDPVDQWIGTMAWHQRQRLGLLRSRLAMAAGDPSATQLATDVMTDAQRRGTHRYAALAHVHLALAGGEQDHAEISKSLHVLRRCAGLELPGLLGELAARWGDDDWRLEAEQRRRALIAPP